MKLPFIYLRGKSHLIWLTGKYPDEINTLPDIERKDLIFADLLRILPIEWGWNKGGISLG